MNLQIVTIGVYGFTSEQFFHALVTANVEVFCDIRLRRGVRGADYSFANSQRLQRQLAELDIRYEHCKHLAPSLTTRKRQQEADKALGEAKRQRKLLSSTFTESYQQECLAELNIQQFIELVGPQTRIAALCCVEQAPEACHRSLLATHLAEALGIQVRHITPDERHHIP